MEFLELCQEFFLVLKPISKTHTEIFVWENVKEKERAETSKFLKG